MSLAITHSHPHAKQTAGATTTISAGWIDIMEVRHFSTFSLALNLLFHQLIYSGTLTSSPRDDARMVGGRWSVRDA